MTWLPGASEQVSELGPAPYPDGPPDSLRARVSPGLTQNDWPLVPEKPPACRVHWSAVAVPPSSLVTLLTRVTFAVALCTVQVALRPGSTTTRCLPSTVLTTPAEQVQAPFWT